MLADPLDAEIETWARELSHEFVARQERAVTELRSIGPTATRVLVQGLTKCDGYVNRLICDALSDLGAAAIEPLSELLDSEHAYDREWAIVAIGQCRATAKLALTQLRRAANDPVASVRIEAVRVLCEFDDGIDADVRVLVDGLSDPNGSIRVRSALYLAGLGCQLLRPAAPSLISALSDGHPDIREYAAEALAKITPLPTEAAEAIAALLLDDDVLIQRAAEAALFGLPNSRMPKERY